MHDTLFSDDVRCFPGTDASHRAFAGRRFRGQETGPYHRVPGQCPDESGRCPGLLPCPGVYPGAVSYSADCGRGPGRDHGRADLPDVPGHFEKDTEPVHAFVPSEPDLLPFGSRDQLSCLSRASGAFSQGRERSI